MNEKKAISTLAVFVLQNKSDVISLINRLGVASLPYDAHISEVNAVVIDNAKELESGLKVISNDGNSPFVCAGLCVAIVVGVLAIVGGVAVQQDISRNRKMRDEIFRNGMRSRYLNKETLVEIALINRKEMQKEFLLAQSDYLQKEENMIQENRKSARVNSLMIVVGGIVTVLIAVKLLKR